MIPKNRDSLLAFQEEFVCVDEAKLTKVYVFLLKDY